MVEEERKVDYKMNKTEKLKNN